MNDLLKINNLSVSFNVDNKVYQAVKNISLNIAQGEALGIVCLLYTSDAADE